jgi:hypothetical protein
MFRAQICAVLGFGLMLAAASTEARELDFSVENRIGVDSNVFRNSFDRVADGFYSLSPRVAVREGNSDLNYDFSYEPTYTAYFSTSGVDGFDHRGRATVSWQPTAADRLEVTGSYSSRRSLRLEDQGGSSPENSDRERTKLSDVLFSYSHALNEALSIQTSATFTDRDYSESSSIDSRSYSGQLGPQYVLDPITVVGLSGIFRRREDRGVGFQFETETDTWNVGASFQRALAPTLNFSVQGGPSFFRSKQKSPVSGVAETESRSTSFFATVVLDKAWQRSDFNASYTRSESSGGGNSSSSIVDDVTLDFNHRLSRRLTFRLVGSWIAQKEIAETPGASKRETTQYRVTTVVIRRMTRQLSVIGQFQYSNQDEDQGISGSESIGDLYVGFLSLRYTFDPIRF